MKYKIPEDERMKRLLDIDKDALRHRKASQYCSNFKSFPNKTCVQQDPFVVKTEKW